jgi:ABC-type multidrug transport system fused ATPase/permease subunit
MVCPERIQQYSKIQPEGTDAEKTKYWDKDIISNDENETFENSFVGEVEKVDKVEKVDVEMGKLSKTFKNSSFQVKGEIVFENVYFRYQPNKGDLVLRDLSFKINAKEKIGIVGRTGRFILFIILFKILLMV